MPPWKPANRRAARVRAGPCHRGQNASTQPKRSVRAPRFVQRVEGIDERDLQHEGRRERRQ